MMFFSRERCRTIWLRRVPWQHSAWVMSSVMQVSGRAYMSQRSAGEWIDWIERSRVFSTQPYTQLAATLLTAGRRSTAEAIQLAGRERERVAVTGASQLWRLGMAHHSFVRRWLRHWSLHLPRALVGTFLHAYWVRVPLFFVQCARTRRRLAARRKSAPIVANC